jgi:hypothetical protein
MKLAVFNGSPRGKSSNTAILLQHFLDGFHQTEGHSHTLSYLNRISETDRHLAEFSDADTCMIAFPLYTDAMPGIVKHFIEAIGVFDGLGEKQLLFMIQSGFPEAVHCSYVEKYLEKLTHRWNCGYAGTILKGGVEGLRVRPPSMTRKLREQISALGRFYGAERRLEPAIVERMRKPFRFGPVSRTMLRLIRLTGMLDFYWKYQLKKYDALDRQFDKPYEERPV